jgi:hypothetical protein
MAFILVSLSSRIESVKTKNGTQFGETNATVVAPSNVNRFTLRMKLTHDFRNFLFSLALVQILWCFQVIITSIGERIAVAS